MDKIIDLYPEDNNYYISICLGRHRILCNTAAYTFRTRYVELVLEAEVYMFEC